MVEFMVAYPRNRAGLYQRWMTVLVDLVAIVAPCLPTLGVMYVARHEYEGPMYAHHNHQLVVLPPS